MKKKLFIILLTLSLTFVLCACGSDDSDDYSSSSSSYDVEETLELVAANALYDEICDNVDDDWSSKINPGKTKYNVATIENEGDDYRVCGTFTLYDDYGQMCTMYSSGSSYGGTFEVIISSDDYYVKRITLDN